MYEAKLLDMGYGFLNEKDEEGATGLMRALEYKRHSLSRWLLSLPGLEMSLRSVIMRSASPVWSCTCFWFVCAFQGIGYVPS